MCIRDRYKIHMKKTAAYRAYDSLYTDKMCIRDRAAEECRAANAPITDKADPVSPAADSDMAVTI